MAVGAAAGVAVAGVAAFGARLFAAVGAAAGAGTMVGTAGAAVTLGGAAAARALAQLARLGASGFGVVALLGRACGTWRRHRRRRGGRGCGCRLRHGSLFRCPRGGDLAGCRCERGRAGDRHPSAHARCSLLAQGRGFARGGARGDGEGRRRRGARRRGGGGWRRESRQQVVNDRILEHQLVHLAVLDGCARCSGYGHCARLLTRGEEHLGVHEIEAGLLGVPAACGRGLRPAQRHRATTRAAAPGGRRRHPAALRPADRGAAPAGGEMRLPYSDISKQRAPGVASRWLTDRQGVCRFVTQVTIAVPQPLRRELRHAALTRSSRSENTPPCRGRCARASAHARLRG